MIGGHSDLDIIITKLEREFAGAEELLVLPAGKVGIGRKAREPLCNEEDVVAVAAVGLKTAPRAHGLALWDVEPPADVKAEAFAGLERCGKVDAHHGVVDGVADILAAGCHIGEMKTPVLIFGPGKEPQRGV